MRIKNILTICIITIGVLQSCKKTYLDAKPDNSLVVPSTLTDFQALLDNDNIMNGSVQGYAGGPVPALGLEGSDDYYVLDRYYDTYSLFAKNVYVWAEQDVYGGVASIQDWSFPYRAVFYSNVVLEGIAKINRTLDNSQAWDNCKGSALFYRAHSFYQLAQVFAPAYVKDSATQQLGLPLKLSADVNEKAARTSLQQAYDQIINDLNAAELLLPAIPAYKTRPSKAAVYGLLARVYQTMENYALAKTYADSCLAITNTLIDYNSLDSTVSYPFSRLNDEVIIAFAVQNNLSSLIYSTRTMVDSNLYNSYAPFDLRRSLFYKPGKVNGTYMIRNSYNGQGYPYVGITTDEIFLIRAESNARLGNTSDAMNDLNTLMKTRWQTNMFIPFTAVTADDALSQILTERRKELVMRGLRWSDLRRLNKDSRFAKMLYRLTDGQLSILPPNDLRYTWPIPADELGFNPGMPQNPR